MPDSFPGLFWLGFQVGRPARLEAAEFLGPTIDEAKVDIGEAYDPVALLSLGDADELADEGFADEDEVATPFDLAIGTHPAYRMVGVIPGILHPGRISPGRGAIAAGRRVLIESLMGSDVVEVLAEVLEPGLLLGRACGRRAGGLGLERAVHALVAAVLLRLARLDPLELDAELDPMNREPGQTPGTGRAGKGDAIVAADGPRQAQLAKRPLYQGPHPFGRRWHDPALDEEAAVGIGEGQRIATLAIPGPKPALEVDAPAIIGLADRQKRPGQRYRPALPAARLAQPLPPQQVSHRRRRRPDDRRRAPLQHGPQFLRAPARPLQPKRDNRLGDPAGHRLSRPMRCTRQRLQTGRALRLIAPPQLIARIPADAKLFAQLRHSQIALQTPNDEAHLLVHRTGFLPRHRQGPSLPNRKTCQVSSRSKLSDMYPVRTRRHPLTPALSPLRGARGIKEGGEGDRRKGRGKFPYDASAIVQSGGSSLR